MAAPPQVGKKGALRSAGRCPDGVGGPGRRSRSGRDPRPGPDRGRPAHHRRAGGRAGSDRAGRAGLRGDDRAGRHRGRDQLAGEQVPARAGCPREPTHTGRLVGRRPRTIRTLLGLLGISRGYYHCGSCQHAGGSGGFAPLDVVLGVTGSSLSPGLARAAALGRSRDALRQRIHVHRDRHEATRFWHARHQEYSRPCRSRPRGVSRRCSLPSIGAST